MTARRASARALAALALAASRAATAHAGALPREGEAWVRVVAPSFVLYSNAGENTAVRVATTLETFRAVLPKVTRSLTLDSDAPVRVFLFNGQTSFEPYKPDEARGFSVTHPDGTYVAINAFPASGGRTRTNGPYARYPLKDLFHEYTHCVLRNNFSYPPSWIGEGLAELYSTFLVNRRRAEIGRAIPEYRSLLRAAPWYPLRDLAAMRGVPDDRRSRSVFYAQAWALVHFLAWGGPERRVLLDRYLAQTDEGWAPGEAFDDVFGADVSGLERDLRQWIFRRSFRFLELDVSGLRPHRLRADPMRREEVLTRLGDLLVRTHPSAGASAEAHFREAVRLDPELAAAWAGLGEALDLGGRHDEAREAYRRAAELDPTDPRTPYLHGRSLLARIEEGAPAAGDAAVGNVLARARALLLRSVALDEGFSDARADLGATYVFDPEHTLDGIAHLEAVRPLRRSRMEVPYNLLVLLARAGRTARAREVAEETLRRSADPFLRHLASGAALLGDAADPRASDRRARLEAVLDLVEASVDSAVEEPARRQRIGSRIRAIRGTAGVAASAPPAATTPTLPPAAAPRSASPGGTP